jgi:hypothetical protein
MNTTLREIETELLALVPEEDRENAEKALLLLLELHAMAEQGGDGTGEDEA